jgi:hypothetical protein
MTKPLATLIAAVAAVQLWLAYRYFGFLTGDDVEVLSEAFRRARGLAYVPWDVRNLFVPDAVVAPMVWLARGVDADGDFPLVAAVHRVVRADVWLVTGWRCVGVMNKLLSSPPCSSPHWIPLSSALYPDGGGGVRGRRGVGRGEVAVCSRGVGRGGVSRPLQ